MANNSSFAQQGATPGVLKAKAMNPAMYGGGSLSVGGQSLGGSYNSNQGAISLGQSKGLIEQHKPSTPVKSITDTQGNKVDFHAEPQPKITTPTTSTTPAKPTITSTTPSTQAENVGQAGQQTSNEQQTQRALQQSGQATPLEQEYINRIQIAQGLKNQGALAPYAEAPMYAGQDTPSAGLLTQPDLAGRASANQGLFNNLSNIYGSQATQGLAAANTIAGRGTQAAQGAYSGAQTQAQRGLTAQTSVLGAGLPTQVSPTNVPFNPLTGTYGQPASSAYGADGLAGIGGLLEQQNQGAQTQNMIGAFNQAKPLIETAKQQIESAGFNVNPLGLANALNQWVNKDVVPSGEYANIFNTLSEIATTISPVLGAQGAQTNLKTMIAQEFIPRLMQGSQISSVLDNIEKNALAKIEAQKSTAQGTPLKTPTLGAQGGGAITWDNIGD